MAKSSSTPSPPRRSTAQRPKSAPRGGPSKSATPSKSGGAPPRASASSRTVALPRHARPGRAQPGTARRAVPRPLLLAGGVVATLALTGGCGVAGFLNAYGQTDRARAADAIVVLGAHVNAQGQPSDSLRRRTLHAVALYQRGLAPKIICTGGVGDNPPAEAAAAATLAKRHGVPSGDVLLEDASKSTWENVANAARICQAHGWKKIIVVSQPYHLWRASRYCRALGLTAYTSPASGRGRLDTARMTAREVLLVVRDWIRRGSR